MKKIPIVFYAIRPAICALVAALVAAVLACAGAPGPAAGSSQEKPHQSATQNVIRKNGLLLSLPDSYLAYSGTSAIENIPGYRFSSESSGVHGSVEFLILNQANKTKALEALIQELEKVARSKGLKASWFYYQDHSNPCGNRPVQYHVMEAFADGELIDVAMVVFCKDIDGKIQPLHRNADIYVLQLSSAAGHLALAEAAAGLLARIHYTGDSSDIRRLPNGLQFHAVGSDWHWISDLDKGFYLAYEEGSTNKYMGIALRRSVTSNGADETWLPPGSQVKTGGNRTLAIGLATVDIEYQTYGFSAEFRMENRLQFGLAATGRFLWNNETYHLYVRNNVLFNPQSLILDDESIHSYLYLTRGGIMDALTFMLELDTRYLGVPE